MEVISTPHVLIIHGWNDDPTKGWLSWLSQKLQDAGYRVEAPHLSIEDRPLLPSWEAQLNASAAGLGQDSLIVAHSLGTFLALRLLEGLPETQRVGTIVLVSGFYDSPDARASHWFLPEPNWSHIKARAERFICIYSDDDHIVTPDRTRRLAHQLGGELFCMPSYGHFLGSRGIATVPELLELLEDKGLYKPTPKR